MFHVGLQAIIGTLLHTRVGAHIDVIIYFETVNCCNKLRAAVRIAAATTTDILDFRQVLFFLLFVLLRTPGVSATDFSSISTSQSGPTEATDIVHEVAEIFIKAIPLLHLLYFCAVFGYQPIRHGSGNILGRIVPSRGNLWSCIRSEDFLAQGANIRRFNAALSAQKYFEWPMWLSV